MSTSERLQLLLGHFKNDQLPELEQKAEAGDAEAQFDLGALYANGRGVKRDTTEAAKWFKKAVAQGQVNAHTLLAWLHANGEGVENDFGEAMQLYLHAAEQGDSDAQVALGEIYENGRPGVEANTKAMLAWYEKAANQNHPKAQYTLGRLLSEGKLVQQNDEAAFQWLTLAIMNESEPAQKELALLTARLKPEQVEQYKSRMLGAFNMKH